MAIVACNSFLKRLFHTVLGRALNTRVLFVSNTISNWPMSSFRHAFARAAVLILRGKILPLYEQVRTIRLYRRMFNVDNVS